MTPNDHKSLYVAFRIADQPIPLKPASEHTCPSCSQPMWIANETRAFALSCDTLRCTHCAVSLMEEFNSDDGTQVIFRPIPDEKRTKP